MLIPVITYFINFYYNIRRCGNSFYTLYFMIVVLAKVPVFIDRKRPKINQLYWTNPMKAKKTLQQVLLRFCQAQESCHMSFYCSAVPSTVSSEIISGMKHSRTEFLPFMCLQFFTDTYFQAFSYTLISQGHRHGDTRISHFFCIMKY